MYRTEQWRLPPQLGERPLTRYTPAEAAPYARLLYFHGGGLLYGSREDLPEGHIRLFTDAGYEILAFDYPLAPAAGLDEILGFVRSAVSWAAAGQLPWSDQPLPYALWGRSAGAYLCLLTAAYGELQPRPFALLSYYGYGFLCDGWFSRPSRHYLSLPRVDASCLADSSSGSEGSLQTHFQRYVYARQTGCWTSLLFTGREKDFYLRGTLRACDRLPCPLFAAHATNDPDVPFEEFLALCQRYLPQRFIVSGDVHDFDRLESYPFADALGKQSLAFLQRHLPH